MRRACRCGGTGCEHCLAPEVLESLRRIQSWLDRKPPPGSWRDFYDSSDDVRVNGVTE